MALKLHKHLRWRLLQACLLSRPDQAASTPGPFFSSDTGVLSTNPSGEETILKSNFGRVLCLLALAVFVLSLPAFAGDAYNNLGNPPSYNCCQGWTIGGASSQVGLTEDAMGFTAMAGGNVSQIDVGLGWVNGENGATISLWTSSNNTPGTELGSWAVSNQPVFGSSSTELTTVMVTGVTITAGQQYFLVITGNDSTWDAWNLNSTNDVGLLEQNSGSGWNQFAGSTLGAFDVQVGGSGGTTPEPASFLLLGTGLLGVVGVVRRKINL